MTLRKEVYHLAATANGLTRTNILHALDRIIAEDREREQAKNRPRIRVRRGASFIVDLEHGIASNTYALGPVSVFCGKGATELVAKAEDTEPQYAVYGYSGKSSVPGSLYDLFLDQVTKADLIAVGTTEESGNAIDVMGDGGKVKQRYNAEYWHALAAVSDDVMIDRFWRRPAVFLIEDTVVGMLMGMIPPMDWRTGE
ncbi:MAG: hypothetical protein ABFE13_11905 [Phycisphaerales bacterium]